MKKNSNPSVLIIGAGPTGLVTALYLTKQGIPVRITDKAESSVTTSRALVIHARTLELYRQLGLADRVLAAGHNIRATNLWSRGVRKGRIPIGDMGSGITMFPFLHVFPQERHERVLEERLNELGVSVERNRELVGFTEHEDRVTARFRDPRQQDDGDDVETCDALFIVGCDGAHSAVRRGCEIGFEGETYSQPFFVVDIEGSGPTLNGEAHVNISGANLALLFPYDNDHKARISGALDETKIGKDMSEITFDDISPGLTRDMNLKIEKVNWFTTYRVHHRVAESFSKGRAFLAGDAAHIHSPVGGQGMNTGIGDAINLAWKLATVADGRADVSLLDTYGVERRTFATQLVQTTDRAFNRIVADDFMTNFVRDWIVPTIVPFLSRFDFIRRTAFLRMSQVLINYHDSALSAGTAGSVQGGDRLPWAPVGELDNFDSLTAITWQAHVYGVAKEELTEWCQSKGIPLHVYPWDEKYQTVGLGRDAAYLIRPDTYVAVAEPSGLPQRLDEYLEDNGLRLA